LLHPTPPHGRGRAATCVSLDEHAFHQAAEKNWAGIYPTLEGLGSCIIISTGNGIGNLFHDLWTKAKNQESGFMPVFIGWHAPAHRDEYWLARERADSPLSEEQFKQEYPPTDNEVFLKTGSCPFDTEWIMSRLEELDKKPPQAQVTNEGRTRIFLGYEPGRRYAAGLDCAQGLSQKGQPDRTSLKIADMMGRHVDSWDGRMELGQATLELYTLLQAFNPYLCVGRNGAGAGMIAALQALGYTNLYRYQPWHAVPEDRRVEEPTTRRAQIRLVVLLVPLYRRLSRATNPIITWRIASSANPFDPTEVAELVDELANDESRS
jgi:hypothetical protein